MEDDDHDSNNNNNNNNNNKLPEAAPASTTPPVSPQRRRALPVCSPATGLLGRDRAKSEAARRDVPRLAGLADYAMRVFLTE